MELTRNTIFITGGTSGIGRGLAEAFHKLGNQVIIAGRRKTLLDEVTRANPGMRGIELDIADPASIDDATARSTIETNLLGPIRMTSSLVDHLKKQPHATIINNTSVLAYVPIATSAVYSATKAALHSYTLSLRFMLRDTGVAVREIAPPWVNTDLIYKGDDPRAMPLDTFIAQTMAALATEREEALVESAIPLRNNAGPGEHKLVNEFNAHIAAHPIPLGA